MQTDSFFSYLYPTFLFYQLYSCVSFGPAVSFKMVVFFFSYFDLLFFFSCSYFIRFQNAQSFSYTFKLIHTSYIPDCFPEYCQIIIFPTLFTSFSFLSFLFCYMVHHAISFTNQNLSTHHTKLLTQTAIFLHIPYIIYSLFFFFVSILQHRTSCNPLHISEPLHTPQIDR